MPLQHSSIFPLLSLPIPSVHFVSIRFLSPVLDLSFHLSQILSCTYPSIHFHSIVLFSIVSPSYTIHSPQLTTGFSHNPIKSLFDFTEHCITVKFTSHEVQLVYLFINYLLTDKTVLISSNISAARLKLWTN